MAKQNKRSRNRKHVTWSKNVQNTKAVNYKILGRG